MLCLLFILVFLSYLVTNHLPTDSLVLSQAVVRDFSAQCLLGLEDAEKRTKQDEIASRVTLFFELPPAFPEHHAMGTIDGELISRGRNIIQ